MTLPLLFSNISYYKNLQFQRCMRNYNIYIDSDGESDEILAEWEEVCLLDFYHEALQYLKDNRNNIIWRFGLE